MALHKKWRALVKKMRRKRLRQRLAQERDRISQDVLWLSLVNNICYISVHLLPAEEERKENSPQYQAWLSEQRALELFNEEEEARQSAEKHAAWLAEEARAHKAWLERQEKLALARAERVKQELRIREEWEEEQKKLKAAKEEQERKALEKQQKHDELMRQIEEAINKGGDMPVDVNVASATNPDRPPCPFFTKTGACRFGDRCSRNHLRPGISRVLLIPNFYDHIGLRQINSEEPEAADDWLEYEDSETYQHFLEFFEDVLPEWERVGRVSQFKVCCNFEPHLKGNVYVEYENVCDAVKAFKLFHGRWYGGKQINVEFVKINSWKAAICGQFHKHCCPKGRLCNFLHVFRNPGNTFHFADHDRQAWRRRQSNRRDLSPDNDSRSWSHSPENRSRKDKSDWRWSASPSPPRVEISSKSRRSGSDSSSRSSRTNSRKYLGDERRERKFHSSERREKRKDKEHSSYHSYRYHSHRDREKRNKHKKHRSRSSASPSSNTICYISNSFESSESISCYVDGSRKHPNDLPSGPSNFERPVKRSNAECSSKPKVLFYPEVEGKCKSDLQTAQDGTLSVGSKASSGDNEDTLNLNIMKLSSLSTDLEKKKVKKKKEKKKSNRKERKQRVLQSKTEYARSSSSGSTDGDS